MPAEYGATWYSPKVICRPQGVIDQAEKFDALGVVPGSIHTVIMAALPKSLESAPRLAHDSATSQFEDGVKRSANR